MVTTCYLRSCGELVSHGGCSVLHFQWRCMRVLISPHPHRYIWLSMFLITAILLGCKVICHCGFDLHFPNGLWCWATFHVLVDHLYIFFRDMSLEILCHLKLLFILANIYWAPTVYWLTGMGQGHTEPWTLLGAWRLTLLPSQDCHTGACVW